MHAITSECVMLACEVDREDAPVRWYKDGQEVEESDFVVLEKEGPHHRLVLPAAQPPDGGEFQCVAGDERAYFTVTITGGGTGRSVWHRLAAVTRSPPGHSSPGPLPSPQADCVPLLGLHPTIRSPTKTTLS